MEQPKARTTRHTCYAPTSATTRCGAYAVAVVKQQVPPTKDAPGGMLSAGACSRHIEYVRSLVRDEALKRGASPISAYA